MRTWYSILSVIAIALAVSGCARTMPIYNVTAAPVVTGSGDQPSLVDVKKAVTTAARDKGWLVKDVDDEQVEATLYVRKHTAIVDITYSPTSYKIAYKDSDVLLYDGTKIHRNYNKWIRLLEQRINLELAKL